MRTALLWLVANDAYVKPFSKNSYSPKTNWQVSKILVFILCISGLTQVKAQVSGIVYKDFNANGTKENTTAYNEVGMAGVVVKATNPAGTALTVSYGTGAATGSTGAYTVTGGTVGQIRLEFTMPDGFTFASNGASGGTTVMFPSGATQDLGVNYPQDYCQSNPPVAAPCYSLGEGSVGENVIVTFPYNSTGQSSTEKVMLNSPSPANSGTTIGTVWGTAYKPKTGDLFTSAFMKRHSAFGTGGTGAIFRTKNANNPNSSATEVFINLNGLTVLNKTTNSNITVATGADPHNTSDYFKDEKNGAKNPSDAVGKIAFGDMDKSLDDKYLYVTNLFDKRLYRIEIDADNNPATNPTASDVVAYDLPNPNCAAGQSRPFGIGYNPYTGLWYIGITCDASSGTRNDLKSFIYSFNATTETFSATPVITVPLNYKRGDLNDNCEASTYWNIWVTDLTSANVINCGVVTYAQPLLSDIVFDPVDGAMILGFIDRFSHQMLPANASYTDGTGSLGPRVGGDILRVCNTGTPSVPAFSLESNGFCGTNGSGNTQPNGTTGTAEFYGGEYYSPYHYETGLGGLALLPGSNEVMSAVLDPFTVFSNGVMRLSNTTGQRVDAFQVVDQGLLFQKGASVGDLEVMCSSPPIEVGNRVWDDVDKDGIQDAGEAGINGVTVTLCLASAPTTAVATAITDANGNYYFSSAAGTSTASAKYGVNIAFNTNYILKFPTTAGTKTLTSADLGGNDVLDSDANASGQIAFTTGNAGQNNHSYDVGYQTPSPCTTPTGVSIGLSPASPVLAGTTVSLTASKTDTTTPTTYTWASSGGTFTSTNQNATLSSPAAGTYSFTVTVQNTAGTGVCTATATSSLSVSTAPVCSLTAMVTQSACQNNGTLLSTQQADDYYNLTVTATGTATGVSGRFEVVLGANADGTGGNVQNPGGTAYGQNIVINGLGKFKADGVTTYNNLIVRDIDNPTCKFVLPATTAVGSCSNDCPPAVCLPVSTQKNE